MMDDATRRLTKRIAERGEQFRRQAIRETDWSETAVLRIIEYRSELLSTDWSGPFEGAFTVDLPEYEVKRYRNQAPPASEHADGERRYSVQTVTKPLLDRVTEAHPELRDLTEGED